MVNQHLGTGFHQISEEAYHADPASSPSLSSGVLSKVVGSTLAEARWAHPRLNPLYESEDSTKFDLGSVAHTLLLGKGQEIAVIDAGDWRGGDAKKARATAIGQGKQPCLIGVFEEAEGMAARAREQLADDPDNRDAFTDACGVAEQVAIAEPGPEFVILRRAEGFIVAACLLHGLAPEHHCGMRERIVPKVRPPDRTVSERVVLFTQRTAI